LYFKKEDCSWVLKNVYNEKHSEEDEQISWKSKHPSSLENCKKFLEQNTSEVTVVPFFM